MKTYHSQKCCSCFYRPFTLEYLDDDIDLNNKDTKVEVKLKTEVKSKTEVESKDTKKK